VDFADVRTVMSEMGMAMMGTGSASGEDRARVAAEAAIHNPLLEDINLRGARGVLVNITANEEVGLSEFTEVGGIIEEYASEDATVVIGCAIDPSVGDEMRVTVVATGLEGRSAVEVKSAVGESVVSQPVMAKVEQVIENDDSKVAVAQSESKSSHNVKTEVVERNLDEKSESTDSPSISSGDKLSYLDIPAFLRRQAD
ncbi:MAG: cell division protein FtsZ, partial [Oceanospirillaceae bacterium]|nr:cell division protein FtsZ [Oceanospirillaceae bacterium]